MTFWGVLALLMVGYSLRKLQRLVDAQKRDELFFIRVLWHVINTLCGLVLAMFFIGLRFI